MRMRVFVLACVALIAAVAATVTGHFREVITLGSGLASMAMLGMPFYYDSNRTVTTNGAANTLSTHLRFLSVANQMVATIMGLYGAARFGTAGGSLLQLIRGGAAGSGGTALTPAKRNPNSRACDLTAFHDGTAITAGTTPVVQHSVGVAQTGGMGGWVALERDHGFSMLPNGGANGNAEVASKANSASVVIEATVEHCEG
jgi:hypothetical protein